MNCDFEIFFIDYINGELKDSDKLSFLTHLENCATCPKKLDEFYDLHYKIKNSTRDAASSEFLSKYHKDLATHFSNSSQHNPISKMVGNIFNSIFWHRSFSFRIAEVVGLIFIGILIGWLIFTPAPEFQKIENLNPEYFTRPISKAEIEYINYYFQAAELLLLEIKNIDKNTSLNKSEIEFNKNIAQKLLIKTFIIHEIALRQNDPKILRFLSKMELLLYEVSNIPAQELQQSLNAFNLIIDESRLLDDARKFQKELIKYQEPNQKYDSILKKGREN